MKLLVSALDPSANVHLESLFPYCPDLEMAGIFEPRLGTPLFDAKEFAVMGFLDVLPKILQAKEAIAQMAFLAGDCDVVLLIDAPAFNIPLAKAIKKRYPFKKIIYYILPKVWAWKKGRVKVVEQYCDELLSIFPFEDQFWTKAHYVGNPLLDQIPKLKNEVTSQGITAFLPGSRRSEITRLMPVMREIAKQTQGEKLLAIPPSIDEGKIVTLYGDISSFTIVRDAREALYQADRAYVCSGTATLEASLIGTPTVLLYKAKALDFWIGKQFVKLQHVGLANIIFDFLGIEAIHPELLQEEANAQSAMRAMSGLDPAQFLAQSLILREVLGQGSAKKVVEFLENTTIKNHKNS